MTLFDLVHPARRHGAPVEVWSKDELAQAVRSGISPSRIILHADGPSASPLRCAINAGVGQYVVDSCQQVAVLATWGSCPHRVLIDVTTPGAAALIDAVLNSDQLELVGLHCRVDNVADYDGAIAGMIETMARIRREAGPITTRLSVGVAVGVGPREIRRTIEDALDESCGRFRFPRPAVVLSSDAPGFRSR